MDAIAIPSHGAYTEDRIAAPSWALQRSEKQCQSHGTRPIHLFRADLNRNRIQQQIRTLHKPYQFCFVPDSSPSPLHSSRRPPSYDVPPAYDDVYTDLPPDYTSTAALAHAHIFDQRDSCDCACDSGCADKIHISALHHAHNPMAHTDSDALLALSQKLEHDFGFPLPSAPIMPHPDTPTIDWRALIGAREQVSKKQKKAQAKAQQAKWADSDNEGEGEGTKDGDGGGGEDGSGGGDGIGAVSYTHLTLPTKRIV